MSLKNQKQLTRLVLAGLTLGVTSAMLPISAASANSASDTVEITAGTTPAQMQTNLIYNFSTWYIKDSNIKKLLITGVPEAYQGNSFAGALNYTATPNPVNLSGFSATLQGGKVNYLYGAFITGEASGNATENSVKVTGGQVSNGVYGGYSGGETGKADSNTVEITGGTIDGEVYGGWGTSGAAENKVAISQADNQDISIYGVVYGGYSTGETGKADSNEVTITGGTVNNDVYGGWGSSAVTNNKVTISQAANQDTFINGWVHGGDLDAETGTANSNEVTITIDGFVFGGCSENGTAASNEVTITGGKINGRVYGGWGKSGATNNKVTISQAANQTTSVGESVFVFGGCSENGTADHNTVEITGGTIDGEVYGGYGYSSASENKVTISQTANQDTKVSGSVYGGCSDGEIGKADSNEVTITGGTIGGVYGGKADKGKAERNEVTITGGTINGRVYGGWGTSGVKNNKVAISQADGQDTKVSGAVYGGYSDGETGEADSNEVTITGGTISSNVYGGYGYSGVKNNKVAISQADGQGTKVSGAVHGGYSDGETGTAASNEVTISGGTINESVHGGWGNWGAAANQGNHIPDCQPNYLCRQ